MTSLFIAAGDLYSLGFSGSGPRQQLLETEKLRVKEKEKNTTLTCLAWYSAPSSSLSKHIFNAQLLSDEWSAPREWIGFKSPGEEWSIAPNQSHTATTFHGSEDGPGAKKDLYSLQQQHHDRFGNTDLEFWHHAGEKGSLSGYPPSLTARFFKYAV